MRIAYFDCFSGASGDMILGALVAAGVPEEALISELRKIRDIEWDLAAEPVVRAGISAVQVRLSSPDHAHERSFAEICAILDNSELSQETLARAKAIFRVVAVAEATVHNTTPEHIHFHELGGLDSVLDIVGAVIGLQLLGIEKVYASTMPLSHGTIRCAHGVLPVPAPAVVEILKDVPFYATDVEGELITPTGAGILKACAESFGGPPPFSVQSIGYGSGTRDLGARPNLLRLLVGTATTTPLQAQPLTLLETNIDDMNPELYDYVMERLFAVGALDVFLTPIHMKKNRPATLLSVLCDAATSGGALQVLLQETTTLGVRSAPVERFCRPRTSHTVETEFGAVRVKTAAGDTEPEWQAPEYDDCTARARERGVPAWRVYEAAREAARRPPRP
ncbi:MAG: TIGR00299 family protein [Armatimonadetes bacterium CG_4_10_14_3_um_filter_66_18]|nr:nickel pincer cofactor biosynthesis protein LarC [Armatimonadota bacterium]OIO96230.1 MAG: TIGR00299 family protein [Armatimonadetes bacterium CG2_30_66_41]PIU94384.1 MAG: TIGR00299 family protein [Armatimonadetes bacterium CG06_land_8_20_14_3_00_66_21]PIX46314.1 MAG: TIGR00299 family protein [Armatimonadetes bacterium CG_4_8_14_3_um_filter_66_20]PIY37267.1 MAG: TIGR00299 family protein [Armatimonadetes bacterium CG_4_10_14_3_um_filter_66_18]PIZ33194.1 MAG: TIGR00299 family protein [Armatim